MYMYVFDMRMFAKGMCRNLKCFEFYIKLTFFAFPLDSDVKKSHFTFLVFLFYSKDKKSLKNFVALQD